MGVAVPWVDARRLPVLLVGVTLIPIAVLFWLGLRTLQQDRDLDGQRRRERLEVAAGRVALEIERRLQALDLDLARGMGLRMLPGGIEASDSEPPVLFQPLETTVLEPSPAAMVAAEAEEFRHKDLAAAEVAYLAVARTAPPRVRAAAIVALGRVRRLQRDHAGALRAYDELAGLGSLLVAGQPAALVARQGRIKTLQASGQRDALPPEVEALARDLQSGRWPIDRPTFDLYRELLVQWGGTPPEPDAIERTEAANALWRAWRRGELEPRGRRLVYHGSTATLAVWVAEAAQATVRLLSGSDVVAVWQPIWIAQGLTVALSGLENQPLAGERRGGSLTLAPADTGLPFIISASAAAARDESSVTRERVFLFGLVAAVLVTLGAAYGLYRVTTREIALASLQADFVSSVSHEFRTPLTSMRHLTELLVSGSVASEDRKHHYYELLARETERLHRLVDSLLSFGRMDVGAYSWKMEPSDVAELVSGMVEDFRREPAAKGRDVACTIEAGLPFIRADREALSRALWNLLENAAKYSEASTPIRVFANSQDASVLLSVQDVGTGIPRVEHQRVFHKFVRGAAAAHTGVGGVGIGLALVTRIVEAHGGSVRLESEPGRGSTFTLVLPCLES